MKHLFFSAALLFGAIALEAQPFNYQTQAPDIRLRDAVDSVKSLNDLRGKVVLIDFWASWCGPCRYANKTTLRSLYNDFSTQGFEIFGISVDQERKNWLKAIQKDGINWIQVNDPDDSDSSIARQWGIEYLPSSFLIDKWGNLVAIDAAEAELKQLIPTLLKQTTNPLKAKILLNK